MVALLIFSFYWECLTHFKYGISCCFVVIYFRMKQESLILPDGSEKGVLSGLTNRWRRGCACVLSDAQIPGCRAWSLLVCTWSSLVGPDHQGWCLRFPELQIWWLETTEFWRPEICKPCPQAEVTV